MRLTQPNQANLLRVALIAGACIIVFLFARVIPVAATGELLGLGARSIPFLVMLVAASLGTILFLIKPETTIFLGLLATALLISQTGMQLYIGLVRTSALEGLLAAMLVGYGCLMAVGHRMQTSEQYPLRRALKLFLLFLPWTLIALLRDVPLFAMIMNLKGYYLYPLLSLLAFYFIRNRQQLHLYAAAGLIMAVVTAATVFFTEATATALVGSSGVIGRYGGSFGPINQFGFYTASMALLATAVVVEHPRISARLGASLVAVICTIAMILTLSRGAMLGFVVGAVVLMLSGRHRVRYSVAIILAGIVLYIVAPDWFWERHNFTSLNDNSIEVRRQYLRTGLHALRAYPLGAGWGAGFYVDGVGTLYPSGMLPWSHNDYLNLAVQIGVPGLLAFLYIWHRYYRYGLSKLQLISKDDGVRSYLVGGIAATTALLVHAATDHIFWRPDIAGQIWWMAGLVLASARIGTTSTSPETTNQ
jgi:hypothetical protein